MARSITALSLLMTLTVQAQAPYIPPDRYLEPTVATAGFWENLGQLVRTDGDPADDVVFYSERGLPRTFIRDASKVSFVMSQVDLDTATTDTVVRIDMQPTGELVSYKKPISYELEDVSHNFYLPHTAPSGVTGVHGYNRIIYKDIYPYVDEHFYNTKSGQKMALVIRPGGTPSEIRLHFTGQDSLHVDLWGMLRLYFRGRYLVLPQAVAYQVSPGGTIIPISWSPQYNATTGIVTFTVGSYLTSLPLIFQIGPAPAGGGISENGLCWSTYLGGPGNEHIAASDQSNSTGDLFVTGSTSSDIVDFPFASGVSYYSGGVVAYVLRFNNDDQLIWKTFYGGAVGEYCSSHGIGVREGVTSGVYFAGTTNTEQLQTAQSASEHFESTWVRESPGDLTGFVARLNPVDGVRSWCTYFDAQGAFSGLHISSLCISDNGLLFITGRSSDSDEIPELDDPAPSPFSTYYAPGSLGSGFVAMFNLLDRLNWRTHLPNDQEFTAIEDLYCVSGAESIFVIGEASDEFLPMTTVPGAYCMPFSGVSDFFVYEFDLDGVVQWSTYLGGPDVEHLTFYEDGGYTLAVNSASVDPVTGDLVFTGQTAGFSSIVPGPGWYQDTPDGSINSFIARFSGVDRDLIWLTYLHGNLVTSSVRGYGTCFDDEGDLYVSASVSSSAMDLQPLTGYWYAATALGNTYNGAPWSTNDMYVMSVDPANALRYGTYFGGYAGEIAEVSTALFQRNTNGNIYLAGATSKDVLAGLYSTYFPLDDGGGTPYFESIWQGGNTESFIASLCSEISTGWATESSSSITNAWEVDGTLYINGLEPGQYRLSIYDSRGRSVQAHSFNVGNDRATKLPLNALSSGLYLGRIDDNSLKFVVH